MREQFNPEPKRLTLTNVKANPGIQSLSQNPHVSNPAGGIPVAQLHTMETHMRLKVREELRDIDIEL